MTPHHYTVCPADPHSHCFDVTLRVDAPDPDGQRFALPAWIPGSYLLRDFCKNIVTITAYAADAPEQAVALEQLDQHRWQAEPVAGPLTVAMRVHAFDTSVRTAYLDQDRGFFNGTSLCLRVEGQADAPCQMTVLPPSAPGFDQWKLATTLPRAGGDNAPWGFGDFIAKDYAELIDHPMELGKFTVAEFNAANTPHAFVLAGPSDADLERLCADSAKICAEHAAMFGGCPPDRYLFLTRIAETGYGGLEHLDCSVLVSKRDALPAPGIGAPGDDYTTLLGLISHEYFHLWNVKRIQPQAVAQSDLTRTAEFDDLWAYEGVTSYYDDLGLVRAGVIEPAAYLDLLARQLTRLERTAGRDLQSLSDSSRSAWTRFYQQDANATNAGVSYYNKGAVVACALDLTIRQGTHGSHSLDDVMRALWDEFGASRTPVPDRQIERVAESVSGLDLADFFLRYVDGTETPPVPALLAQMGVRVIQRARSSDDDRGGRAEAAPRGVWLGFELGANRAVRVVRSGSPAQAAGLAPGDVLVAINQRKASGAVLAEVLKRSAPGDGVTLHVFRQGLLRALALTAAAAPMDTWALELDPDDAAGRAARTAWLSSSASAGASG